ncbi:MAG TPA: DUF1287 domain-containing protein [Hyphomicrobiaceae bacterium]|nr:DUF1287 domain-containing protein [Hyphomicrobiaceae bacterium]
MLCLTGPRANAADPSPQRSVPAFGVRLAQAALEQTATPTFYSPAYYKIPYPMGDVPWYIGVCTDVVVRAYRALGIDLQRLVHEARVGTGDTNIDHRRVAVLQRFFAKKGQRLTISDDPRDYLPGDIVTYHLPDGWFSNSHIAIVSDRMAPSGAPFVIHNRGFGVQLEDWLFAARITGHYRYTGPGGRG